MGSFNLFCAATGIPLTYNDPVVAFRVKPITGKHGRGDPGDCLTASHYIVSWPIIGTYDDYGYINGGEETGDAGKVFGTRRNRDWIEDEEKHEDPDDGEYMIFHRFAWESMMASLKRERERHATWQEEWYAKNGGPPDWKVREQADIEAELAEQDKCASDPDNYEPSLMRQLSRGYERMFYAPEGERPHTTFWRAAFEKSAQPREFYEAYNTLIEPMHVMRMTFGFDFRPSLYAGQEVDDAGLYDLHSKAAVHCKARMAEYKDN